MSRTFFEHFLRRSRNLTFHPREPILDVGMRRGGMGQPGIQVKMRSGCFPEIFKESPGEVMIEDRPWGSYTVLEAGKAYKVKRIEVLPGQG